MALLKGTLDVLVLKTLSWGPMHAFEIATWLEGRSAGRLNVEDAALMQALHRMEERGWVESSWGTSEKGKRAKFYNLTPAGRRALRTEQSSWERYVEAVARVMTATPQPA